MVMAEDMDELTHSPGMDDKDQDDPMDGGEDDDYGEHEYDDFRSKSRGPMRNMMGGPDFGPRGPPPMGMGRPPGPGPYGMNGPPPHGPHGPHGLPPRFRGRGFGPRGPPGFRGPPPPHFGGPRGPGPRFRGGPPPNWDPAWGPPPGMGPPPHMMGPPPPGMPPPHMMGGPNGPSSGAPSPVGGQYGPPPGMGVPPTHAPPLGQPPLSAGGVNSMDLLSGEVWVETKAGDGKVYYYNARTRDTTWSKPEGADVKILTQEQVESLAQQAGVQPGGGPGPTTAAQAAVAQANSTNTTKSDGTDGTQAPGTGMPNTMQPPPGMMQGPPPGMPPFGGPPPQFGGPPPFGMPPPGFSQGYPPGPGAYNAPPGGAGAGAPGAWNMPPQQGMPPGAAGGMPPGIAPMQIDPELMACASEWTEHRAPDGRSYYYNAKLAQSVWEKPQPLKDLEMAKLAAAQGIAAVPIMAVPSAMPMVNNMVQNESGSSDGEDESDETVPAGTQTVAMDRAMQPTMNGSVVSMKLDHESDDEQEKERKRQVDEEEAKKKKEDDEKAKELQRQQDRSRPVSSTPVPGTPWCVVWTGDGRVFFYNPSSRTSVWERPEDLVGRADVDKMVNNPPDAVLTSQASLGTTTTNGVNSSENSTPVAAKREVKNDEEQPIPAKKIKKEEPIKEVKEETKPPEKKQIEVGKEAAMEAEVRAARERAIVPLETRIKSFREMLAEKEVSAFSTWEKELHKIVFDPRYLLLTSKERKQVFEKYVKERAEEERREKRNKMKERRDDFRRLMEEANLHGKSSFSDFAQKYGKDERFRNIEKMREREGLFNEYLLEVRKREKEEKIQRREQTKREFFEMLRERSEVDRHARWSDCKKLVDADPRYRAVDSSTQREDWFREHVKQLKEERKREKERRRSRERRRSKDRDRDRDRERSRDKDKDRSKDKDKDDKERKEDKDRDKDKEKDKDKHKEKDKEKEKHKEEKEEGENDDDEEEKGSDDNNSEDEREREQREKDKQARVEASLREREKEVQRTLATHMRDRDKEREQHKFDEAVQHFNALLADLVRNADLVWKEAKRQLRKDSRWELAELLDRDKKEALFMAHVEQLGNKKRDKFREMLGEVSDLTLTSSWKDVKKVVKDDPRYTKFSSSDRKCEREFKEYLKDKLVAAKADFRELLQETKLITHKSFKMVQENEAHLREIEEILKKDKRYLILDYMPEERTRLLKSYLEDLEKRGPPPPPTASEPTRRPTK